MRKSRLVWGGAAIVFAVSMGPSATAVQLYVTQALMQTGLVHLCQGTLVAQGMGGPVECKGQDIGFEDAVRKVTVDDIATLKKELEQERKATIQLSKRLDALVHAPAETSGPAQVDK